MNSLASSPSTLLPWKCFRHKTEQGNEHEIRRVLIRGTCREDSFLEILVQMVVLKQTL
jgi:hypothetical protein